MGELASSSDAQLLSLGPRA